MDVVGFAVTCAWGALAFLMGCWWVSRRAPWPVECANCGAQARQAGRRQLYLELWDSSGMMYAKWPVGKGEMLDTEVVSAALVSRILQRIRLQVELVNRFQAGVPVQPAPYSEK